VTHCDTAENTPFDDIIQLLKDVHDGEYYLRINPDGSGFLGKMEDDSCAKSFSGFDHMLDLLTTKDMGEVISKEK
jgi:hypothetical protein